MSRFSYILATLIVLLFAAELYAQTFIGQSDIMQQCKVGLVDEFIKRFNGTVIHPLISEQDSSVCQRNLSSLIAIDKIPGDRDSIMSQSLKFIDTIVANSVKLNYTDSTWVALAECCGHLADKPVTFNLLLNVERRKSDMFKWVIAKAEGQCFSVHPRDTSSKVMLYPDDHETRFISLNRMTSEQPYNIQRFMSKGVDYDATSAFLYLVYSGNLKIDYVQKLEFIFTQVPGYVFHITHLERNSVQAGWLITKFYPVSDSGKNDFLKSLHLSYSADNFIVASEPAVSVNNNSKSSMEEMFNSRVIENLRLLKDYIFTIRNGNQATSEFYQKKLMSLFSVDACARINFVNRGLTESMSIYELCGLLMQDNKGCIRVDSIVIPVWDNKVETIGQNVELGRVASKIITFDH